MNRRNHRYLWLTLGLTVLLVACGKSATVPKALIGNWKCAETASDGETYTGFYALEVQQNGEFSLYDQEAGNPGIEGTMKQAGKNKIACKFRMDDFDPPVGWEKLQQEDCLEYEVVGDNEIRLGYDTMWLTFTKKK